MVITFIDRKMKSLPRCDLKNIYKIYIKKNPASCLLVVGKKKQKVP